VSGFQRGVLITEHDSLSRRVSGDRCVVLASSEQCLVAAVVWIERADVARQFHV
jgi:hypothetical protein